MKKYNSIIILAVLALILLNIWKWWPDPATSDETAVFEKERFSSHISELQLRSDGQPLQTSDIIKRNIFSRVSDERENKAKRAAAAARKIKIIKAPRPVAKKLDKKRNISKLSIDRKIAEAELAKFDLVGVMRRDGKIQAYLVNGADSFTVTDGEIIDEKYMISVNSISELELKDKNTKIVRKLSLDN